MTGKDKTTGIEYFLQLVSNDMGSFEINGKNYAYESPCPPALNRLSEARRAVRTAWEFANRSYEGSEKFPAGVDIRKFSDGRLVILVRD